MSDQELESIGVKIDGVAKVFSGSYLADGKKALKGIKLQLLENQIFGLLGHNGFSLEISSS